MHLGLIFSRAHCFLVVIVENVFGDDLTVKVVVRTQHMKQRENCFNHYITSYFTQLDAPKDVNIILLHKTNDCSVLSQDRAWLLSSTIMCRFIAPNIDCKLGYDSCKLVKGINCEILTQHCQSSS